MVADSRVNSSGQVGSYGTTITRCMILFIFLADKSHQRFKKALVKKN